MKGVSSSKRASTPPATLFAGTAVIAVVQLRAITD
jgi:hypothetical protein